jgi:hypothetical protein
MLGGMLVWAAHFLAIYALASIFGSGATARVGVGLVTAAALAADVALLSLCVRAIRADAPSPIAAWLGATGAALSTISVAWQGLPAAIG